jgi:hypothetical protein
MTSRSESAAQVWLQDRMPQEEVPGFGVGGGNRRKVHLPAKHDVESQLQSCSDEEGSEPPP